MRSSELCTCRCGGIVTEFRGQGVERPVHARCSAKKNDTHVVTAHLLASVVSYSTVIWQTQHCKASDILAGRESCVPRRGHWQRGRRAGFVGAVPLYPSCSPASHSSREAVLVLPEAEGLQISRTRTWCRRASFPRSVAVTFCTRIFLQKQF